LITQLQISGERGAQELSTFTEPKIGLVLVEKPGVDVVGPHPLAGYP
jgi:hypothetical protein